MISISKRASSKDKAPKKYFTFDFIPGDNDVIIARGKKCYEHRGNVVFRQIVSSKLDEYSRTNKKTEKSKILRSIVSYVREGFGGHFIRYDPDAELWFDTGDFIAREKVSQTFRDFLHTDYRSSNEFKKKRRQYLNSIPSMHPSHAPPLKKSRKEEQRKDKENISILVGLHKRTALSSSNLAMLNLETGPAQFEESSSTFMSHGSSLPRSASLVRWFEDEQLELNKVKSPIRKPNKSNWFAPAFFDDHEQFLCSLDSQHDSRDQKMGFHEDFFNEDFSGSASSLSLLFNCASELDDY